MLEEFRRRVRVDNRGDRRARALIRGAIGRLARSPTARELMREFVALGAEARVSLETFADSAVVRRDGRRALMASAARTSGARRPRVELNRDVLRMDRGYRRDSVPGHLGHELLGHVLEESKARRAGMDEAYRHYRHNETNAALIGWIVKAELGADPRDVEQDDMRVLLRRGMAAYHRSLQSRMPYYAVIFSREEMSRPVPVLKERLVRVRGRIRAEKGKGADGDPSRRRLERIARELEGYIRYWSRPEGRESVRSLRSAARSPFLIEAERNVRRRLRRLRSLMIDPNPTRPT
jgi:hypothetical protein